MASKLSLDRQLRKAGSLKKKGRLEEAKTVYRRILQAAPTERRALEGLRALALMSELGSAIKLAPYELTKSLIESYNLGSYDLVIDQVKPLCERYPADQTVWNLFGAATGKLGRQSDSLKAFEKVIDLNPDSPEGQNNYGNALLAVGDNNAAIRAFQAAISLKPDFAVALKNLGNALRESGRLEDSADIFEQAIAVQSNDASCYFSLGQVLEELGRITLAIAAYKKAAELNPEDEIAFYNLGLLLKGAEEPDAALEAFDKALKVKPDFVDAHVNRGVVLTEKQDFLGAAEAHRNALRLRPDYLEAYYNLGISLALHGDHEGALLAYETLLAKDPNSRDAQNQKGRVLRVLGRFRESLDCYYRVLKTEPNSAETYNNIGGVLSDQGRLSEALEAYERAVALDRDYAVANCNLGIARLKNGEFSKGFDLYEWRWRIDETQKQAFRSNKPLWSGTHHCRVFIWSEQGVGDVLMFASILEEMVSVCSKVILRCDKRLIPLFRRSFPSSVFFLANEVEVGDQEFDYHIPIGSLPMFFRRDLDSFKDHAAAYLRADPSLSQALRARLSNGDGRQVIGVSWRGGSNRGNVARSKDILLPLLAEVFDQQVYKLVNLQYGSVDEEFSDLVRRHGSEVQTIPEIDNFYNLDGLAAIISSCDYVVSVDNLTVHISGALGVKTFVMLPYSAQWRWGCQSRDSYWHDQLTLLRQTEVGSWREPLRYLSSIF